MEKLYFCILKTFHKNDFVPGTGNYRLQAKLAFGLFL